MELSTGFAFKSSGFIDGPDGVRLLRGDNVGQGRLRWGSAKWWPIADFRDLDRHLLAEGDVILAMDRPWISGGLKQATVRRADLPAALVQRVARLRARPGLDQGFLAAVVGSQDFEAYIRSVITGSAVPHISGSQILAFPMRQFPPEPEQQQIASTLGALDDRIESNRRLQSICWEIINVSYEAHVADSVRTPLGLVLTLEYGRTLPGPVRSPGDVPVFGSGGCVGWHDRPLVEGPTIVVGRKGTVGAVHWSAAACWPIDTTFFARPHPDVPALAAYMALRRAGLAEMNSDSAVPGLNRAAALASLVASPCKRGLQDWNAAAEELAARAEAAAAENRKLAELRDALLPELLSGRLRVPVAAAG